MCVVLGQDVFLASFSISMPDRASDCSYDLGREALPWILLQKSTNPKATCAP